MIGYDPLTSVKQVHESSKVFANTQLPRYNLVYNKDSDTIGLRVNSRLLFCVFFLFFFPYIKHLLQHPSLRSMSQFGISVPGKEPTEQLLGYDVNHTMAIIANSTTS